MIGETIGFALAENWITNVPIDLKACFPPTTWSRETHTTPSSAPIPRHPLPVIPFPADRGRGGGETILHNSHKNDGGGIGGGVQALQMRVTTKSFKRLRDREHPPTQEMKEKLQKVIRVVSTCDPGTAIQLEAEESSSLDDFFELCTTLSA